MDIIKSSNLIKDLYPNLVQEWHSTKNMDFDINFITKGSRKKVWWICSRGHEWETVVYSRTGNQSQGCPYCCNQKVAKENSIAVLFPELCEEWNYSKNIKIKTTDLSKGSGIKVWWRCSKNSEHEWQSAPNTRIVLKSGCPYCAGKKPTKIHNLAINYSYLIKLWSPRNRLGPENYSPKSNKKVWWKCDKGHEWKAIVANISDKNQRCPYCCTDHTNLEKFVESKLNITKYNRKALINNNYRPDYKLSDTIYLNVDGLYWHSIINKSKDYHFKMREAYELEGKRILQFYEDEVYNKWNIVESIINNNLGKTSTKLNARECIPQQISTAIASDFYTNNHLMGSYKTAKHYGLLYESNLVSIISVRFIETNLEISRFCTKLNTNIRGGFSKLLSHVIKLYNPKQVISFCDLRYATGKSYEKVGFVKTAITQGWQWTDFDNRYNRLACKANDGKTENENAIDKSWTRIYDAGQAKYILDIV